MRRQNSVCPTAELHVMTRANFQDLPIDPPDPEDPQWVEADAWVWDGNEAPARHEHDTATNSPESDWLTISVCNIDVGSGRPTLERLNGKDIRRARFLSWPDGQMTFLCAFGEGMEAAKDRAQSMIEGLGWKPLRLQTREDIEADRDAQSN